jgi:TonB family protein
MKHLIIYVLESSICLAVFMMFYQMLLKRDTRHGRNRFFLLFSIIVSVVIPVLNVNIGIAGSNAIMKTMSVIDLPEIDVLASSPGSGTINGLDALSFIYFAGLTIAFISFLISLSGILLLILTHPSEGRLIRISSYKHTCFSAFGYIFISTSVSPSDAERMISHELNHIRKNHFADLVLVSFISIFQWFNPAAYAVRKSLQAIHEYEADEECLSHGEDIASYQSLLVSAAFSTNIPILTNKFSNKSLLKKRVIMMTKKKTGSFSSIKMLLALPLAALMFFTFSCKKSSENKLNSSVQPASNAQAAANASEEDSTINGEPIFVVCEQMPSFPGGDKELLNFIATNVKYPEVAKENNIQGRIIVKFCVTKEGKVSNIKVVRSVDPSLDKEALRVVNSLPDFMPGTQGGKNVNVWYTLPINFTLK